MTLLKASINQKILQYIYIQYIFNTKIYFSHVDSPNFLTLL